MNLFQVLMENDETKYYKTKELSVFDDKECHVFYKINDAKLMQSLDNINWCKSNLEVNKLSETQVQQELREYKVKDIKLGDVIYSDFTEAKYIVCVLPRITNNKDFYALVRKDGRGWCYFRDSLEKLQREIYLSGEQHYVIKYGEFIPVEGI